jgi:two-component system response regulator HydG
MYLNKQKRAWGLLNRRQVDETQEVDKMNAKTKVLVVDDEEVVRRSYVRTLTGESCAVEVAWNGKEALLAMEQQPFDVVLLDQRMPEMDGMEVLKTIKEKWPESEVIMITGYPAIESAKQAVTLGAYDYLAKPVGPDEVINVANAAMLHKMWALRGEQQVRREGAR